MGMRDLSQAENSPPCPLSSLSLSAMFPAPSSTVHISHWVLSSLISPSCPASLGLIYLLTCLNCLRSFFALVVTKRFLSA